MHIFEPRTKKKLCRLLRIQSRSYPVAAANNTETIYTKQIYKITAKKLTVGCFLKFIANYLIFIKFIIGHLRFDSFSEIKVTSVRAQSLCAHQQG